VGADIGAELIGGSMYELEPGDRLWPYHTHHANEEWVIVVRGEPTLRTPDGEQALKEASPSPAVGLAQTQTICRRGSVSFVSSSITSKS
jgi:uncharacterized cupin superfamily protein